jgi:hypothetical protein
MDATPSSLTGSATPPQRTRKILAIILAGLAVAASMAWTPALLSISDALRPLDGFDVYRWCFSDAQQAQLHALTAQAQQEFSVIALIGLVMLVALVALSIVAGRRALRETASAATLMRMGRWSLVCLVGGLAFALGIYLISFKFYFYGNFMTYLAVGIIPALEVVSIILGSIALLRPTATPASGETPPKRGWRILTRIGVVVASLSALTLFTLVYLAGVIFIGFLLGFEF